MDSFPLRHLLVSVDNSPASVKSLKWALDNLFKEGDSVHLFHVIPPGQYAVVSTVGFMSTDLGMDEVVEDDAETQRRVETARLWITSDFVPLLEAKKAAHQIEIIKFAADNDSIGSVICKRADQLNAAAVVMCKHNRGKIQEFFVGSVTNYCTRHCRVPVLVMHEAE